MVGPARRLLDLEFIRLTDGVGSLLGARAQHIDYIGVLGSIGAFPAGRAWKTVQRRTVDSGGECSLGTRLGEDKEEGRLCGHAGVGFRGGPGAGRRGKNESENENEPWWEFMDTCAETQPAVHVHVHV